jgi:hypothetical protein
MAAFFSIALIGREVSNMRSVFVGLKIVNLI